MGKISFSPAIKRSEDVWKILEDYPNAKFTLEIIQEPSMFRISQDFDPLTDKGTDIVDYFGTPIYSGVINAWIRYNL